MHKNELVREKAGNGKAFAIVGWYFTNHMVAHASALTIRLWIVLKQDQWNLNFDCLMAQCEIPSNTNLCNKEARCNKKSIDLLHRVTMCDLFEYTYA